MPSQASEITDRGYVGKFQKIWFCVSGHAESLVLFTLASSHIYDFACPCKINHWFRLPWQAPEFMILLAGIGKSLILLSFASSSEFCFPESLLLLTSASSNIDNFACQCSRESQILLTLAIYQICDFGCSQVFFQAKESHWCCFPWQASTSIFFLARASKTIFWFTLVSYRIGDCACQGKRNHWFCLLWQAPTFTIALVGASKIIDCCWPWRAPTSSFACQGNAN